MVPILMVFWPRACLYTIFFIFKGNNFCDFLSASLSQETLSKKGLLLTLKMPNKQDLSQGQDSSPDSALPIT